MKKKIIQLDLKVHQGPQNFEVPVGSRFLCVRLPRNKVGPSVCLLVDPDCPNSETWSFAIMTNNREFDLENNVSYLGTLNPSFYDVPDQAWHIFGAKV